MARYRMEAELQTPLGQPSILLQDVQSVVINLGRKQIQDPFRGGTATITGRNPQNLPALEIGSNVFLQVWSGTTLVRDVFSGKVSNLETVFGEVSNADTWSIQLEDGVALAGRSITTNTFSWSAGITTDIAAQDAGASAGVSVFNFYLTTGYAPVGSSFVSAQSLPNANLLSVLNDLALTEQGRIVSGSANSVGIINRSDLSQGQFITSFTDGSLTATYNPTKYNEIRFASLGDSAYDKVTVEPAGLTSQTSGTGARDFVAKTFDQTTSQASNLADYILATLSVNTGAPLTISGISEVQVNDRLIDAFRVSELGWKAELILRGQRYNVFLNGATLTATPEQIRVTLNVVSSDALNFFILDSPVFGRLDADRLGF